ncbi:MAG: protein translocase subunit SecF [Oscillospiraceae bacterium]|nr:protein translocase subunit SecF [Oscillospiraceae bacterium]
MIDFIGKRRYSFAASALVMAIGLILFAFMGINLDIQFEGGSIFEFQIRNADFVTAEAEALVRDAIGRSCSVQKLQAYSGEGITLLRIQISKSEGDLTGEERSALIDAFYDDARFHVDRDTEINVQYVDPSMGDEMRNNGIMAVAASSLMIIVYIAIRFRRTSGFSAGVTIVVGLLHDAVVVIAFYVLFRIPINDSFIAAILTILGYSANDTIVIYDRVRENVRKMPKAESADIVNKSINQSLTRTINTSATTIVTVAIVFAFAKAFNIQSLVDFTIPLILGFTTGIYSSLFICSPLWVMWLDYRKGRKRARGKGLRAKPR